MKPLITFINENRLAELEKFAFFEIPFDRTQPSSDFEDKLEEAINHAVALYKTMYVEACEKANAAHVKKLDDLKAAEKEKYSKEVWELLKTRKTIVKKSAEKQQEWVDNKLAEWEKKYDKSHKDERNFLPYGRPLKDTNIDFGFMKGSGWAETKHYNANKYAIPNLIEDVMNEVTKAYNIYPDQRKEDKHWRKLKKFIFTTNGFLNPIPRIMVSPIFDEETYKEMDKQDAAFAAARAAEENSPFATSGHLRGVRSGSQYSGD